MGQADGGRDALRRDDSTRSIVAFQVKSKRDAESVRDAADWLIEAVNGELPRINRLVDRGITEYRILTNVGGTGRLDTGTMDRVDTYLASVVPVPSECWWGDDIDRRLEVHSYLRWQYPELLTGMDVLAELFKSDLSEQRHRRARALRVFLDKQFQTDSALRFKQTDLHGTLFGLFVDVQSTLRLRPGGSLSTAQEALLERSEILWPPSTERRVFVTRTKGGRERPVAFPKVGTADLLLTILPPDSCRIVLEGAPGQGKSTLGQYLCQVHRLRILERPDELARLPMEHQVSPVRVPFRIDLRDLATWMEGEDPFTADGAGSVPEVRTLETFLAALISNTAGGLVFSVDDLHSVIEAKDIVLVLDGLDEVANIEARAKVVEAVQDTVDRLCTTCRTAQVLVTSRPAAFANSPGFPEDRFIYLTLAALPRSLITRYAEQWVITKALEDRHAAEVKSTLHLKLSEPHIRDLARNPMQLAILLGLISSRGTSLPDKRTAIYDAYMDVFFSREAEKDEAVRRYRELLIELHGFIAWHLHTSVERNTSRGNISQQALADLLRDYLEREGRDPNLAGELFRGTVERVVALVSRVEGTYEFEVQPLREYFCARYLYLTAPLSRVGVAESGSKPDRFDAIARNPYWLNVARFYAGCYSKGELGGLADAVELLWADKQLALTDHPRILTTLLLNDYVFSQSPPATSRVLSVLLRDLGTRHAMSTDDIADGTITLPEQCGRNELRLESFAILAKAELKFDRLIRMYRVIESNGPGTVTAHDWLRIAGSLESSRLDYWFNVGGRLRVFGEIAPRDLAPFVGPQDVSRVAALVGAGDNQHYQCSEEMERVAASESLGLRTLDPVITDRSGRVETLVGLLHLLETAVRGLSLDGPWGTVGSAWVPGEPFPSVFEISNRPMASPTWLKEADSTGVGELCRRISDLLNAPAGIWRESEAPWETVIGSVEEIYGPTPATFMLALLAAQTVAQAPESAQNESLALAFELFAHKTRSSGWTEGLAGGRRLEAMAAYFAFAPSSVLARFHGEIESHLAQLSVGDRSSLRGVSLRSRMWYRRSGNVTAAAVSKVGPASGEFIKLLDMRLSEADVLRLIGLAEPSVRQSGEVRWVERRARLNLDLESTDRWPEALPVVLRGYSERGEVPQHSARTFRRRLPIAAAETVVKASIRYPLWLVEQAEERLRLKAAAASTAVGEIAKRDRWYSALS